MSLPIRPHWVDHLHEKHECWSYDKPGVIEVQHGGRTLQVLMPSSMTGVQIHVTAESGPILFLLGRDTDREFDRRPLGVVLVAKHREGNIYEVGVWHALYPWALNHFNLPGAVAPAVKAPSG